MLIMCGCVQIGPSSLGRPSFSGVRAYRFLLKVGIRVSLLEAGVWPLLLEGWRILLGAWSGPFSGWAFATPSRDEHLSFECKRFYTDAAEHLKFSKRLHVRVRVRLLITSIAASSDQVLHLHMFLCRFDAAGGRGSGDGTRRSWWRGFPFVFSRWTIEHNQVFVHVWHVAAWDDKLVASPEPSASVTDTVPSVHDEDSVDHWAGEVLRIEREMRIVMLKWNELKAKLTYARGRHMQTVRAREVKTPPTLGPEAAEELVAASPVAAGRVHSVLTSPLWRHEIKSN